MRKILPPLQESVRVSQSLPSRIGPSRATPRARSGGAPAPNYDHPTSLPTSRRALIGRWRLSVQRFSAFAKSYHWGRWAFLLSLFLFLPSPAAPPQLTAKSYTQDLNLRKGAPIPLEIDLTNNGARLLEGRLEATVLFRDRGASIHQTNELVLAPGMRSVSLLLPPPVGAEDGDRIGLHLRWLAKDGTLDLGEDRLGIYGFSSNELILAVGRTDHRLSELDTQRESSLPLGTLRPRIDTPGWLSFNTLVSPVDVVIFPTHPLGWCAYDAVYLDTPAFAAMNEKQLTALARWIEAGGSLCVCTGDPAAPPLVERHATFLNRLAKAENITFLVEGGRLTSTTLFPPSPLLFRAVLGRVTLELPSADFDPAHQPYGTKEWKTAVGWFWKLRAQELQSVKATGGWLAERPPGRFNRNDPPDWQLQSWVWSNAIGYGEISPDKPRPLPLGLVILLLGTLLLVVGPGDWYLLGWLRRRRWTWVLLPVACLASAWWASHLATGTIGRGDRTGLLVLTDLGPDGAVLREGRLEMLLPAHDREWTVSVRDGLTAPFPRVKPLGLPENSPAADLSDVTSIWKTPTLFESHRNLRQWTPVMTQTTSFPEATDTTGIDWKALVAEWAALPPGQRHSHEFTSAGWTVLFASWTPRPWPADDFDNDDPTSFVQMSGTIPVNSRVWPSIAESLLAPSGESATATHLVAYRSPSLTGLDALRSATATPLTALAWKESPHEIQIVRRHFLHAP